MARPSPHERVEFAEGEIPPDQLVEQPTHVVTGASRGWAWVRPRAGSTTVADAAAETTRHQCGKDVYVVVGDQVSLGGGYVTGIGARRGLLRRQVGPRAQVLAAHVDQVVLVTAAGRALREGFVMRGLVACAVQQLPVLVVLNKVDEDPEGVAEQAVAWRSLGVDVLVTSAVRGDGVAELEQRLSRGIHALMGHSGVGKSSLINALRPGANRRTGDVDWQGKGRHITTMAEAIIAPGSMLVDLPGIRELGLWNATVERVLVAFPDVVEAMAKCRFTTCRHGDDEEGCGVWAGIEAGTLDPTRVELCLRMQESVAAGTEGGGRG